MDKYLFTDGINGVQEAFSSEELLSFINNSPEPEKARVWVFGANEWITTAEFFKKNPALKKSEPVSSQAEIMKKPVKPKRRYVFLKQTAFVAALVGGALLIYNFTDSGWQKAEPLKSNAARPANVPVMDADSLQQAIEEQRGKTLDKGTANNLRLRNNWPEQLLLQLTSDKEVKRGASRFLHIKATIDNATGYTIDEAEVILQSWKNGKPSTEGSFVFTGVSYGKPVEHIFSGTIKADSISVSFRKIRAKAFNFCYDAAKENQSGNYNDRWFCRDGKQSN